MSKLFRPRNAMVDNLYLGYNVQKVWGWPHALWFTAMGTGGALFILRHMLNLALVSTIGINLADVLAIVLVLAAGSILIADLGRSTKFVYALTNPLRSRISIGAIADFVFIIVGLVYVMPDLNLGGAKPFEFLPWTSNVNSTLTADSLLLITGVSAFVVAAYAGFVLSFSPSIPFWNTEIVPIQFLSYSFVTALSFSVAVSAAFGVYVGVLTRLETILMVFLTISLVLTLSHLINKGSSEPASRFSVNLLLRGKLRLHFLVGVLSIGLIVPLILTAAATIAPGNSQLALLIATSVLTTAGGFMLRYSILKAGVYPPPVSF